MQKSSINVVLVNTYELGHQPFGLASPAAWLRRTGAQVTCQDLARRKLDPTPFETADLVAFYLPMHTATRIAVPLIDRVRALNRRAHLCAYGLYAPMNADHLREHGVQTILGGEFEARLAALAEQVAEGNLKQASTPEISWEKLSFIPPDRTGLPTLSGYANLVMPDGSRRIVGYTEGSRGCKHLCRHCPIVPVYEGRFRIVQPEVVLADIEAQVAAGAQHITFGDPDFFNGVTHGTRLVRELHERFPDVTYDVTIKIEHLIEQDRHLPLLKETGCAFVTTAVESIDDRVLGYLDKGHRKADFIQVVNRFRELDLALQPTFVAFHPWTTLEGFLDLLRCIAELDLVANVAPVQYTIRLIIPAGSKLLELPEALAVLGDFDRRALSFQWRNPDPRVDALQEELRGLVEEMNEREADRNEIFAEVWARAHRALSQRPPLLRLSGALGPAVPYLTEPWFC